MIELEVNPNLNTINWKKVSELFQLVDWGIRNPNEIENSFRKSSFTCFVKDDNEIIGFGRTVDDGKYYALLVDIVIHPDYQSKGIGKTIVNDLRKRLEGYNFITLTAAPNKEGFYQKLGWIKQKSAYIFPKDDKQINEHCE
jgi:N-acetylglutamate synthase-like GNAT family acetyltransferase